MKGLGHHLGLGLGVVLLPLEEKIEVDLLIDLLLVILPTAVEDQNHSRKEGTLVVLNLKRLSAMECR